ncbi:MAG: hypothetical protein ACLQU4_03740 [Limisphaerales bacterium]
MKFQGFITSGVLAASALLLASSVHATPNLVFDDFCYNISCGVPCYPYLGPNGTYAPGIDDGSSGDCGSMYVTFSFAEPLEWAYAGYDGGTPWFCPGTVDFSQYTAITFDILWDTTSGLTIDQFNTGTNWCYSCPGPLFTEPEAPNFMVLGGYGNYTPGIDLTLTGCDLSPKVDLGSVNIPTNAAFGWQTMTVPIPANLGASITSISGIMMQKYASQAGSIISSNATGMFWVDNIVLIGTPPPPPTLTLLNTPPVPGLNVWNLTEGEGYLDHNEVVTIASSGLSWVGSNTSPNTNFPVAYSFTLTGFPANSTYADAFMFLVPNATGPVNAPDWTEATCMAYYVQSTPTGAQISLYYKTNQPNSPLMIYAGFDGTNNTAGTNAAPAAAAVPMLYGTYSLVFTDANDGYVSGPDNVHHSFSLGTDGTTWFEENTAAAEPFLVYLGGEANDSNAMNQAVVYSSFAISGVSNGFSENFLTETATVNVTNDPTTDPASVFIVPTTAAYWVSWTPPTTGFVLENAANLAGPWQTTTYNPQIAAYGEMLQLVDSSDLVAPTNAQFFQLVQR